MGQRSSCDRGVGGCAVYRLVTKTVDALPAADLVGRTVRRRNRLGRNLIRPAEAGPRRTGQVHSLSPSCVNMAKLVPEPVDQLRPVAAGGVGGRHRVAAEGLSSGLDAA